MMKLSITSLAAHEAVAFALDLANSEDPARQPSDLLADPDGAAALLGPYLTEEEDPVRVANKLFPFRDTLRRAFKDAAAVRKIPCEIEEQLAAALASRWQIIAERAGEAVVCVSPQGGPTQRLSAWAALGYFALSKGAPERLRVCQSEPCEEIFRDETKSGRQRFCSKRCANRFNVARHRSRQKS